MTSLVLIATLLLGTPQRGVLAGTRTGVISGQVRSPDGVPVSGIRVAAMEAPDLGTQDSAVSVMAGLTQTDEKGHYRLEDIPVGRYFVVVGSLDNLSYYPNSITLTAVTPIDNLDVVLSDSYSGTLEINTHLVGSSKPVPGAVVNVQSKNGNIRRSGTTNSNGIATITGVPYGDFAVSTPIVSMAETVAGVPPGNTPQRELSVIVTINPDRPKWTVSLGLLFPASVQGTVRDSNGMPVDNVMVSGLTMAYRNGRRTFAVESSTRTDSKGNYVLLSSPGEHYIRATPAMADSSNRASISYYPATSNPGNAKSVIVGNGEVMTGLDIEVARTFSVTGKIVGVPPNALPPEFVLVSRSGNQEDVPSFRSKADNNTGDFELQGVPSGDWDLVVVSQNQSAKTLLNVTNKDLDGVRITLQSVDVRGKVSGMGTAKPTINLVPLDTISGVLYEVVPKERTVEPDGSFVFRNVPALRYRLEMFGLLPGSYVADIRMGAASIFNDNLINVGEAAIPSIDVDVRTGAGTIEGRIANITDNTKLQDARVVLIPDEPRSKNLALYRTASVRQDGTFSVLPRPAPGNYRIFAVTRLPVGHPEWNLDFVSKYSDISVPITVLPNQTIQPSLELTRAR